MVWLGAMNEAMALRLYHPQFTGRQDDYYSLPGPWVPEGAFVDGPPGRRDRRAPGCQRLSREILSLFRRGAGRAGLPALPPPDRPGPVRRTPFASRWSCWDSCWYLRLYAAAKRQYFPALSRPLQAGCVALLAFGAGQRPSSLIVSHCVRGGHRRGMPAWPAPGWPRCFGLLAGRGAPAAGGWAWPALAFGLKRPAAGPTTVFALPGTGLPGAGAAAAGSSPGACRIGGGGGPAGRRDRSPAHGL